MAQARLGGRIRRSVGPRRTFALLLGMAALVGAFFGSIAVGADYAATASVSPKIHYLNDVAGSSFTFTVTNTGDTTTIGAVQVRRPVASWTVLACESGPAGWAMQRADPFCRFRSADGTADDIAPGASATFTVRLGSDPGAADRVGTFEVSASRSNQFDQPSVLTAAVGAPGDLDITAHSFQVLDAVVATAPATPGGPCPASNKVGNVDSIQTVVICGKNRSTGTLTPTAALSSLGGSLLSSTGTFSSGSIAANSASSVVLGNWAGAQIRTLGGTDLTIVAVIAASATHTSSPTALGGYTAFNSTPVAVDDGYSTNEDGTLVTSAAAGVLANDSDADGHSLTAFLDVDVEHGELALAPDGSFTYDPDPDFGGDDSFTYHVEDGHGGSDQAIVVITVAGVNDPPTASDHSYGTAVGNTLFAVSRPLTSAPVVHATGNLLDGASDADGPALSVVPGTVASAGGGSATLFADGTFTYISEAGETATSDSFSYVIDDGAGSQSPPATVSIALSGDVVWYVDNADGAGDGRSTSSFNSLSSLQGAGDPDAANETIFVFEGAGPYGGGLILEDGQRLLGQPAGLVISSQTLFPAGTGARPAVTNAAGDGLTLANGNVVESIAVDGAAQNGVSGANIAGFSLLDLSIAGNGDSAAALESGIRIDGLTGTAAITDTEVSGSAFDNVSISAAAGSASLAVSGSTFRDNNATSGGHGLRLSAGGSASVSATIDGSTFRRNHVTGVSAVTAAAGNLTMTVDGGTFDTNFVGIDVTHASSGSLIATIDGNSFSTTATNGGAPINLFLSSAAGSAAGSALRAIVSDNTVTNNGSGSAPGIWYHTGTSAGHARLLISGNEVSNVALRGISIEAGPGTSTVDATLVDNSVSVDAGGLEAIFVQAGTLSTDSVAVCADIRSNTATSPGSDIRVRQRFSATTLGLPTYAGLGTDDAAVAAFLAAQNTTGDTLATHQSATGFGGGAACTGP
jgi:VCBS repeat-containing protein